MAVIAPVIVAALGNGNDPVALIAPPERSRNQRTGATDSPIMLHFQKLDEPTCNQRPTISAEHI